MGATKPKKIDTTQADTEVLEVVKKVREPKVRSKVYISKKALVDRNKFYSITEAVAILKETSYSKFDGTVELHIVTKKSGISVNVVLPHSTGKTKKVEIASDETIEKLKTGKIDFDVLLATAEMMPKLVAFAKLLGPRGLMPNPKTGTLIKSAGDAKKFSADSLTLKTEKKAPLVHTSVGKVSQTEKELKENIESILKALKNQIVKIYIKPTMGPSIKVSI